MRKQPEIIYTTGNIFESDCDILVNPVNTFGSMGGGLARAFAVLYAGTTMESEYIDLCKYNLLVYGEEPKYWYALDGSEYKHVCQFATLGQRYELDMAKVRRSLELMQGHIALSDMSIAFPKLAAGIAGADWMTEIKPMYEELMPLLPFSRIEIYV